MGAMTLPLTGGCLCGALRYETSETPSMAYTCHCTDCQHLTSSAFSLAITVTDGAFLDAQQATLGNATGGQRDFRDAAGSGSVFRVETSAITEETKWRKFS